MSDNRRVIVMYADVEASKIRTSDNNTLRDNMVIFRGTEVLIQCHLRLADGTTYLKPPSGAVWTFVIDNSFTSGHADLVVSTNTSFNKLADWSLVNPDNGLICFRVNAATTALATEMGTSSSKDMYAELWYAAPGDSEVLACQWNVTIRNIVADIDQDTGIQQYSTGLLAIDGNDVVLYFPDGQIAQRWTKV